MKLLLEISMECESLARAEAMSAATALGGRPRAVREEPGVLVMETSADPVTLASRLGLCHFVDEWLASCKPSELDACAEEIDVAGPIRVRSTKVGKCSVDLAAASRRVGTIMGNSRGVDLHNPTSDIRVVCSRGVTVGRAISRIDRSSFEKRKNRYMPFFYPASLHPKYARALVNLARVRPGGRLLDPFCGTGAILAEAHLSGLRAVGTDLSEKMIEGSRRNLAHVGAEAELLVCDVGDIKRVVGQVDGIATDPPYGRATSTKGEKIPELFSRSLRAFSAALGKNARASVVTPDLSLVKNADGFKLVDSHALWVHRSLTRHFCVLERT